jgi:hypothetical protein
MTRRSRKVAGVASIISANRKWISKRCEDGKCNVKCHRCDGRTCFFIDCEKYKADHDIKHKLADCLYLDYRDTCRLAAIELKGGSLHVRQVIEQIKNCLSLADSILWGHEIANWNGVLLHRGIDPNEFRILRNSELTFRGKRKLVLVARCGTDAEVLIT